MAMMFTNDGLLYLLNNVISGSTDFRMAVFTGAVPSAGTVADWQYLSSLTGASTEAAAANYSRKDLASVGIVETDASDIATLSAAAPAWTAVGTGETWTHIGYYIYNASDASAPLICVDDPSADLITNGGDVTGPTFTVDITAGAGNFTFCNRGLYNLLNLAVSGSTDLRCTPFTGTKPSAATVKDWNTLQDALDDGSSAESTFGSARQDLSGVTVAKNATTDLVEITANAPTWTSVTAGETWTFVVYYIEGASDTLRELVAVDLTTTGQVTNGSNISYSALSVTVND